MAEVRGTGSITVDPSRVRESGRITVTYTYTPGPGQVTPDDYHVEYKRGDGPWHPIAGADHFGPVSTFSGYTVQNAPTEAGTYTVRVRWTVGGKEIDHNETTLTVEGGCFIATAAYGSELAPEVRFLQGIRDNVLRQTQWGRKFFNTYRRYYYQISPAIAEEMDRDPQLRKLIGWSIVTPWVHYMKLLMYRPDWERIDMDTLEPTLREFLCQLRADMETWLSEIELPSSFANRDPFEAAQELNIILSFILRSGGMRYLDELVERSELPLFYSAREEADLRDVLLRAGRSREEVSLILYRKH